MFSHVPLSCVSTVAGEREEICAGTYCADVRIITGDAGGNAQLVCQAIEEMVQYYQYDDAALAREVRWMGIMTRRADIIPLEDKRIIEGRLSMFDDLMEKDPKMRRIRAESEARGRVEGLQSSILTIIEARFPALLGLAQQRVNALANVDELTALLRQVLAASNEEDARSLLTALAA